MSRSENIERARARALITIHNNLTREGSHGGNGGKRARRTGQRYQQRWLSPLMPTSCHYFVAPIKFLVVPPTSFSSSRLRGRSRVNGDPPISDRPLPGRAIAVPPAYRPYKPGAYLAQMPFKIMQMLSDALGLSRSTGSILKKLPRPGIPRGRN
jgi:hypothetical protein